MITLRFRDYILLNHFSFSKSNPLAIPTSLPRGKKSLHNQKIFNLMLDVVLLLSYDQIDHIHNDVHFLSNTNHSCPPKLHTKSIFHVNNIKKLNNVFNTKHLVIRTF
jgi:hypothetical protein